jgi:hypothetical protein
MINRRSLVAVSGLVASVMIGPASGSDERIANGIQPPASDTAFDPICRIGVISSSNGARLILSTGTLIAPGVVFVSPDSVFNTSGQSYKNFGGTLAPHFLRFRRFPDGSSDNDSLGLVYDVDVLSVSYLPLSDRGLSIAFIEPSDADQIIPMPMWFSSFPAAGTETLFRCGHGSSLCNDPGVRSTEVLYMTRQIPTSNFKLSSPDYYEQVPRIDECGCATNPGPCQDGGITGGDSGGPWIFDDVGVGGFAYIAFGDTSYSFASLDGHPQRALREFAGLPIYNGTASIKTGSGSVGTYARPIGGVCSGTFTDDPEQNTIVCAGVPGGRSTFTIPAGATSYTVNPGATTNSQTRTFSSNTGCQITASGTLSIETKATVVQMSNGEIELSVGTQQIKTASYVSTGGSGAFNDNQVAVSRSYASEKTSMVRVPIVVEGDGPSWFGLKLQGSRAGTGDTVLPTSSKSRAYWVLIRDPDGDGVIEPEERVAFHRGVRDGDPRLEIQTNIGLTEYGVEHFVVEPGDYVLEVGVVTDSSFEILRTSCGGDASLSGTLKDTVKLIMFPDAPCGSADFDLSGFVDPFDYDSFLDAYENGTTASYPSMDINRDGFEDFFDFDMYINVYEGLRCDGGGFSTFEMLF